MTKLLLRARGGLLVPNPIAFGHQPPRYVGRQMDPSLASKGVLCGWPAMPEGEEITLDGAHESSFVEYLAMHCREKALWPGNQETAKRLGVTFDPKFGGEFEAPAVPATAK